MVHPRLGLVNEVWVARGQGATLTLSISHWNPGLGAAATLRPLVPSPVRTRRPLGPCPSRHQALGPRTVDSLGLDPAQEVNGCAFPLATQLSVLKAEGAEKDSVL